MRTAITSRLACSLGAATLAAVAACNGDNPTEPRVVMPTLAPPTALASGSITVTYCANNAPIWSGAMTRSLAATESLEGRIPGGVLSPGQTYIWALTRPVAGDSQPVATGCLRVLSANERRGLSTLLDGAETIGREGGARPGDATSKLLTAAAYLAYAMNTAAADYLDGALKQRSDNEDLRELATTLLHRPFSVRPVAPVPGTKSAAPAVGEATP